ncbi:MAG TPA: hypothetical protein VGK24_06245, partial [Candidatus Angelobacter sp.]
ILQLSFYPEIAHTKKQTTPDIFDQHRDYPAQERGGFSSRQLCPKLAQEIRSSYFVLRIFSRKR